MSFRTNDGGKNLYLEADGITFAEPKIKEAMSGWIVLERSSGVSHKEE